MVRGLFICVLFFASGFFSNAVFAASYERGKELHDEDCLICHKPEVYYLREKRIVKTLPKLIIQLRKCQLDVGAEWEVGQFLDVLEYVNTGFYKFYGLKH
jgi:hypothetical protein